MKHFKLFFIALFFLFIVACSAEYNASFIDENTAVCCPVCNLHMSQDDFYDHTAECEVYCCYCGESLVGIDNYVPFYCNICAIKDYPEYFCHDCDTYFSNGIGLVNNHCAECYKKLSEVVKNYDFNSSQFNHSKNTFVLDISPEDYNCSYCGEKQYKWDTLYAGNFCEDCATNKFPDLFCLDCKRNFIPENIVNGHCLTCLFDFKAKLII